ncbi:MAG: hypothetical protein CMI96_01395 [Pelagibacteraceae bacterium]|nr:hypothetical protein [Pelagibacteraceae bacterium]|tara:strand:+ start:7408 stop:8487 length:1080 start_codon:yes stop_codon:yes gene_type:complete
MNKLNFYLFNLSTKYILINLFIILFFVIFLNLIEISRVLEKQHQNVYYYMYLSILKIPSIINETIPFIIIIGISFLFRNLINNNELIAMRNVGYSIFDIFKPISISVTLIGLVTLFFLNPLSTSFEKKYEKILNKQNKDLYSIKFSKEGMWIKNKITDKDSNYINIKNIDLKRMIAKNIKILTNKNNENLLILSKNGIISQKKFILNEVNVFNISNNTYEELDILEVDLNFSKDNIINSIINFKHVPFYSYYTHIKTLKKFNLYSSEIGLFYISEILKPFFIVMLAFVVVGFTGKFKRNENFFKILFYSILIGFLIFFLKEILTKITISLNINFIYSYSVMFLLPFLIGLYQIIKIEND